MPRPKRKKQYYDKKDRTIYMILNPESKEFYIGHTLTHNLRSTYKDHYIEIKYKTASMISKLKTEGQKPCCFQLESLNCTPVKAYRYVIIWTKIMIENGFINLDTNTIVDYANDLLPENIPLYLERKTQKTENLISCATCIFPDYGRTMCSKRKELIDNGKEKRD